jgi:transcriptional regulator with XRE-family HTH domain
MRSITKGEVMKKVRAKAKTPFSEQLKQRIEESELTRYRIAKESGVAQSTLSSFVNGQRALSLTNIDKICDLLDLQLVPRTLK